MITTIGRLHGLKELRVEKSQDVVKKAHAKVHEAETASAVARDHVKNSLQSLSHRRDEAYRPLLQRVVSMTDLQNAREAASKVDKEHSKLVDEEMRAGHVLNEAAKKRDEAVVQHNSALKAAAKYKEMAEIERRSLTEKATAEEENEVDETFADRGRIRI